MTDLNSAVWADEPGWLQKKRQLATMLSTRFPYQTDQERWLQSWQDSREVAKVEGMLTCTEPYVALPLSQAVNEYSEMLQENLMEKAISWQDGQLNAAHLARIDGGQFIYVPDDTVLDEPIKLAPVFDGENPHNVIIVGADSRVVIEETAELTNTGAVYAGTELLIGSGAEVVYRQFNRFEGTYAYQAVHAYQAQGSQIQLEYGQGSDSVVTTSLYSFLDGRQTRWQADAAILVPSGAQQRVRPVLDGFGQGSAGSFRLWGRARNDQDLQLTALKTGSGEPLELKDQQFRLLPNQSISGQLPDGWLKNKFEPA